MEIKKGLPVLFSWLVIAVIILSACSTIKPQADLINVVTTTTIVGDIVRQIGGDRINLTVLLPTGADPHTYEPRPQDAVAIADADIVFINGLELEHSLEPLIESNAKGEIIAVSDGVEVLPFSENHIEEEHEHASGDPHTWLDPNLVMIWVDNITTALSNLDPSNAEHYAANSISYIDELSELDNWIKNQVDQIPVENRMIVTDHANMGYFAKRYGFSIEGLVVNSLSTGASPSAQELSNLEQIIIEKNVKSVFVSSTVNPSLSEQVASDTGTQITVINAASLGDETSGATNYIELMHKLVSAIVEGLK